YPNNPTAGVASHADLERLLTFARRYGTILCHDAAYSELAFDGLKPPSLLELEGAREVAVEFHSLSKTYNMTGWRIGWACGAAHILAGLSRVKSNIDSGIFQAVQHAGIAALTGDQSCVTRAVQEYQRRRDLLVDGLGQLGWQVTKPQASFYVWARVPASPRQGGPKRGLTSAVCAKQLLDQANIVVTPGSGFGAAGEGYVRFALTIPVERIRLALDRLQRWW
ncbi:MAG: aminotransferase class I/II-fold pyridoxal phosphate-dependent enzyme, partial [Candidatus Omnitrophica bacterium]|nr:aminotransferase class I/II-fold pyridoxal phosphate-dependent enzyme [Candidatus Omnitrophota bacterium]